MSKKVEHIHWPDAPDLWMPYTPVIRVTGGRTIFLAGVTAAPVYHHHPHRPEEFDGIPEGMEAQAQATMANIKKSLAAAGAKVSDIVMASLYLTDFSEQPAFYKVWNEFLGDATPATTMVQVVQLATDPRCLLEINAIAIVD